MTADGTTFDSYFANMRQLMLDKFASSELVVINRAEAITDKMAVHKAVRQASRRCDIAYEYADGSVAYDDIKDELPFDINAPVIELKDDEFGLWYMDASETPEKYKGKTIRFKAQVCQTPKAGKGCFVPGRFAMTCCVDDITFVGFICKYDDCARLEQRAWIWVTAKINVKYHPIYRGGGSGAHRSGGDRRRGSQRGISCILSEPRGRQKETEQTMDWKKEIREWLVALAGAVVAGILLTQFIIVSAVVPSRSMQDTINPGDRIVGFRLSYLFSEPQRGDMVIFRYPDDETQFYVKRVIGLPGETVEVKDGFVLIDGQPLDEPYIKEQPNQDSGPWTVPEGCYFMMGDKPQQFPTTAAPGSIPM